MGICPDRDMGRGHSERGLFSEKAPIRWELFPYWLVEGTSAPVQFLSVPARPRILGPSICSLVDNQLRCRKLGNGIDRRTGVGILAESPRPIVADRPDPGNEYLNGRINHDRSLLADRDACVPGPPAGRSLVGDIETAAHSHPCRAYSEQTGPITGDRQDRCGGASNEAVS